MRLPESAKPQTLERRQLQGFLPLWGRGIDVGVGRADWPDPEARQWWRRVRGMDRCDVLEWDVEEGDAQELASVPDASLDWLFSSHCLEHLASPSRALVNWVRVVKPGGYLLLSVPHRLLYERRPCPPSRWNGDHKWFFLPYNHDGHERTIGFHRWLTAAEGALGYRLVNLATGDWGHTNVAKGDSEHPDGEYCIDALLRRHG